MHAILTHPVIVGLVVLCAVLSLWKLRQGRVGPQDLDIRSVGRPKRNYPINVRGRWIR